MFYVCYLYVDIKRDYLLTDEGQKRDYLLMKRDYLLTDEGQKRDYLRVNLQHLGSEGAS